MVPEGWSHYRLKSLGEKGRPVVKAGPFGSALKKDSYTNDGFKVYGQEQVIAQDPYSGTYYIDKKKYDSLISCQTRPGDVLMSLVGTIGKVLVIPDDAEPGVINPRLLRISPSRKLLRSGYFKYVIQEKGTQNLLARWAQGGTMGVLNAEIVGALPLNLPSINEQDRIVKILSTWDQAIETTEKLIENSKAQKKALMQQLLTGKRRLPVFSGEWRQPKFEEIFDIEIGGTPSRSNKEYWDPKKESENRWLSIADIKSTEIEDSNEYISDQGIKNSNVKLIPAGTIVMSFKLTIGRKAILKRPCFTNEAICALHIKDKNVVETSFLYHALGAVDFDREIDQAVKGRTLNKRKLQRLRLGLPLLAEQRRISAVLSLADQESKNLVQQLERLKQEKKSLLQQLLTGKRRVKVAA